MKVLLDLQGCQSKGSRNRGIGRYSLALAKAMIRIAPEHEFWLLLNGAFPETLAPLREAFGGMLPAHRVVVFQAPVGAAEFGSSGSWRTRAAELLRAHVIDAIGPDVVHIGSLFEGLMDDCVTTVAPGNSVIPVAVTVYDLIPLLYGERYLAYERTRTWYLRKLDALANADLLLGISSSACAEAQAHLRPGQRRIVNISSAADPKFCVARDGTPSRDVPQRLGLNRPFVMYTGGIDWRKNLEGLIRAYAMLPKALRSTHQLALVCEAESHARDQLLADARSAGLTSDELVLTGFVSDEDLVALYRACALFVFASLHEGFGLPALEAMMCGAPVIGSNTSSIPEVIGRADALFDPRCDQGIAELMTKALEDERFRQSLKDHSAVHSARFSWELTARLALQAMEQLQATRKSKHNDKTRAAPTGRKPRLAMVSPAPPAQSGIADYCAALLPVLAKHYDIELIVAQPTVDLPPAIAYIPVHDVDWFRRHAASFDRIVYQFGNSEFHNHMFALLHELPGVVVLHDFFLSSVLNWMEITGYEPRALHDALLGSHGGEALQFDRDSGRAATVLKYPASRLVTERATGVIVHSAYSIRAADHWYGAGSSAHWRLIRHLRAVPQPGDRVAARRSLGLAPADFLICCFGHLGENKLNLRLLKAWSMSALARDASCRLVFVGENSPHPYGAEVAAAVAGVAATQRVSITGFVNKDLYQTYLCAADAAVQLRGQSRGETSGAVLDCLAIGVPTLVNTNGSMAEYPDSTLCKLPNEFSDEALAAALESMHTNGLERKRLSAAGIEWVREQHDPNVIATQYHDAIEHFAVHPHGKGYWRLVSAIAALSGNPTDEDKLTIACAIAVTLPALPPDASLLGTRSE